MIESTENSPSVEFHSEKHDVFISPALQNRLAQARNLTLTNALGLQNFFKKFLKLAYLFIFGLAPKWARQDGLRPKKKAGPTSYLDALRGIAALIVVNHHGFPWASLPMFNHPPFIQFLAGRAMVDVFFVISGYVLGLGLLKLMRAKDSARLLDTFASSMFRRYLRLYLSAICVTFVSMLLVRGGFKVGYGDVHRYDTFYEQFWDWFGESFRFANPFAHVIGYWRVDGACLTHKYDEVLWTIPVEFRGSMVLYAFCLATCKMATKHRMILMWITIVFCYYCETIWAALFLMGLFIADLNLCRQEYQPFEPLIPISSEKFSKTQSLRERAVFWTVCFIGFFLLGQHNDGRAWAPWPWPYLEAMVPEYLKDGKGNGLAEHFWLSIGAFLLILALDSCPELQTPLKWNFPRYLGEISFGMYVMHLLLRFSLYENIFTPWRVLLFGQNLLGHTPFLILHYGVVIWAGDLFSRFDAQLVKFGRSLQQMFFIW